MTSIEFLKQELLKIKDYLDLELFHNLEENCYIVRLNTIVTGNTELNELIPKLISGYNSLFEEDLHFTSNDFTLFEKYISDSVKINLEN